MREGHREKARQACSSRKRCRPGCPLRSTSPFRLPGTENLSPSTIRHFELEYQQTGPLKGKITFPLNEPDRKPHCAGTLSQSGVERYFISDNRSGSCMQNLSHSFMGYNACGFNWPTPHLIVVQECKTVWWLWQNGFHSAAAILTAIPAQKQVRVLLAATEPRGHIWILTSAGSSGRTFAAQVSRHVSPARWIHHTTIRSHSLASCSPSELTAALWKP